MHVERALRLIAGFFILLSVALAHFHSPYWLWFTAFVGLNLLQSGFTNWCPMMYFLKVAGVKEYPDKCCAKEEPQEQVKEV